jgi:hypothetical protein
MKIKVMILFLFISSISYPQDLFESQCWKNTLREIDTATVIIAIANRYDNFIGKDDGRKPMVIYHRDSLQKWYYRVILVDLKEKTWAETNSRVEFFFENYLNDSIEKIKDDFERLYKDPKRELGTMGYTEFYFRDKTGEIVNNYNSLPAGINGLLFKHHIVFDMYSYAINRSFNINFFKKIKFK